MALHCRKNKWKSYRNGGGKNEDHIQYCAYKYLGIVDRRQLNLSGKVINVIVTILIKLTKFKWANNLPTLSVLKYSFVCL